MRCKIHRGANEIGGSCYELEAQGKRLVLDVGLPIIAAPGQDVLLPEVAGLKEGGDPSLFGVCITHPHPDHYGLLEKVSPSVPVYIGAAAARLLSEAAFFSPSGLQLEPHATFEHRKPLAIGPFTVTPYLNDHSAFDAYSLLVEADGRRLFYTGDSAKQWMPRVDAILRQESISLNRGMLLKLLQDHESDGRKILEKLEDLVAQFRRQGSAKKIING